MPTISGWSTGEPIAGTDINTYFLRGSRNAIINGDMRINQRQLASVGDDAFCLDRWNVLSDGATITTTQSTVAPSDGKYSIALSTGTNGKKFGIAQYVENLNCAGMFGQMVTLSFKAKVSNTTNIGNVKAGVLSWSSTADSLTSDFVSAWGASGTTPTLISNWTFENTPSNLGVTTSWATYRVQGIVDTASAANVAAFIWCDSTAVTSSDYLYITDVQLEIGSIATPFERRPISEELVNCQRYYEKSYNFTTAPGTSTDPGFVMFASGNQAAATGGIIDGGLRFEVMKRTDATVVVYDPVGTINRIRRTLVGAANYDNQTGNVYVTGQTGFYIRSDSGNSANCTSGHYTASAEL